MDAPTHIDPARREEHDAIVALLLSHADSDDGAARAVAERIAAASLGDQHLWREMRLSSRAELRALFATHFPDFAAGNDRDMRWKKYLYKRLCGWPGFHG